MLRGERRSNANKRPHTVRGASQPAVKGKTDDQLAFEASAFDLFLSENGMPQMPDSLDDMRCTDSQCNDEWLLHSKIALSGFDNDGMWDRNRFAVALAGELGHFDYLNERGDAVGPASSSFDEVHFELNHDVEHADDPMYGIYECVKKGQYPSADIARVAYSTSTSSNERSQIEREVNAMPNRVYMVWQDRVSILERHLRDGRCSFDRYRLRFVQETISGDGACLYRSLASGLVYLLTGLRLGPGVGFGSDGSKTKWEDLSYQSPAHMRRRNADPRTFGIDPGVPFEGCFAMVLNSIALWIKFYCYLVLFGDRGFNLAEFSYSQGVQNVAFIRPMTNLSEMFAPDVIANMTLYRQNGMISVPSLRVIVHYAMWLLAAIYQRSTYDQRTNEYVQRLDWKVVRPYAAPLFAIPWDVATRFSSRNPHLPDGIRNGYINALDADGQVIRSPLLFPIMSVLNVTYDSTTPHLSEEQIYENARTRMLNSSAWGGYGEVMAFSSVMIPDRETTGILGSVIFARDQQAPNQRSGCGDAVLLKPFMDDMIPVEDGWNAVMHMVSVIFLPSHYNALHQAQVDFGGRVVYSKEPIPFDQLWAIYIMGREEPGQHFVHMPEITSDSIKQAQNVLNALIERDSKNGWNSLPKGGLEKLWEDYQQNCQRLRINSAASYFVWKDTVPS